MKHSFRSRFPSLLFGFAAICLITAPWHHPTHGLATLWAICCGAWAMWLPTAFVVWISILARAVILIILLHGFYILGRRLRRNYRFVAEMETCVRDTNPAHVDVLARQLQLPRPPAILDNPAPLAFCYGLFRPRICLSIGLLEALSTQELTAVLLHEAHHCRHHDPLRTLLADVLAATFFFMPVVTEWRDMLLTSMELAADRYAVQFAGRPSLAGAMYKLLTFPHITRLSPTFRTVAAFSATHSRLAQLLDDNPVASHFTPRGVGISSLALMLGCALLYFFH